MLQQKRPFLADQVKDVGRILRHLEMVHWLVRLVMQGDAVNGGNLPKVALGHNALHHKDILAGVQPQLRGKHALVLLAHGAVYFQAYDLREFAFAQGRFNHDQQINRLIHAFICYGITSNPKFGATLHHHAWKDGIQIVGNNIFKKHIHMPPGLHPDKAGNARAGRDLDAVEKNMVFVLVAGGDQQVQGEVGDKRKRVGRVHALGREQRIDVFLEVLRHVLLVALAQLAVLEDADIFLGQQIQQHRLHALFQFEQLTHHIIAFVNLLLGSAAIGGELLHPCAHLLLEAADALHEELVQVGTDDGEKIHPLQ